MLANLGNTTSQADAVTVEGNGDILVAGSADTSASATDVLLALYSPSGQLVSSFGSGGTALIAVGDGGDAQANTVVLDGSNVLVGGQASEGGVFQMFYLSVNASTGATNGSPTFASLGDQSNTVANAIALDGSDAILAGSTQSSGVKRSGWPRAPPPPAHSPLASAPTGRSRRRWDPRTPSPTG